MVSVKFNGDIKAAANALVRFDSRAKIGLAVACILSFASGLLEALTLTFITAAAVSSTSVSGPTAIGPISFNRNSALIAAGLCLLLRLITGYLLAQLTSRQVARTGHSARTSLLISFKNATYEERMGERLGSLQERLTTHVDRFQTAFSSLNGLISNLLSLASFAFAALLVNSSALLGLAVIGLLMSLIQRPFADRARQASRSYVAYRSEYTEGVTESVVLAKEMAVFGVANEAFKNLVTLDSDVSGAYRRTQVLSQVKSLVYYASSLSLAIGALAYLGGRSDDGVTSIASVALLLLRSLSYGQSLLGNLQTLSEQRPFINNLIEVIDRYEGSAMVSGSREICSFERIELNSVSFSYGQVPALSDLNLEIGAGEVLGIVGPSGAGKTTLANLLLRLYTPSSGAIIMDGLNLQEVDDKSWNRLVAVVPQDARLLKGSFEENIKFYRDIHNGEITRAADSAHIGDFIRQLPGEFDAPVGELGLNLSGGQRQRVCIARALAGRPQLLILDEPTSALDGESEAAIQETLTALKGSVTMVVIAHRLSTLSICDRIVVVDKGTIIDIGSPEELIASSDYFKSALAHASMN